VENYGGRGWEAGLPGKRGSSSRSSPAAGVRRRSRGGRALCGVARSKREVVGVAVESMTSGARGVSICQ
jgi:hypothetical protein